MKDHDFTLKFLLSNAATDPQKYVEALAETGCEDAVVGVGQNSRIALNFIREAESALGAVSSALEDVQRAIPSAKLVEITSDQIWLEKGMIMSNQMPTFYALMNPLLDALFALGGSGSVDEIYEKVLEQENIDEEISSIPRNPEKSNQTEVAYRLAWARTYLKKYGFLENSSRGIWALTKLAKEQKYVEPQIVLKDVREAAKASSKQKTKKNNEQIDLIDTDTLEAPGWKEELHQLLTKEISPDAFERLTQRLLRESGFVQVEVTGRTGDGGIDGKGIARIHGFMSFHVIFQCKKYQGSVSAGDIRDFRGAMVGRADKGLFITTGTFTPAAVKEATRDGAPPIDLVDGEQLAEKLKELQLGLNTEMIEKVTIDKEWFANL